MDLALQIPARALRRSYICQSCLRRLRSRRHYDLPSPNSIISNTNHQRRLYQTTPHLKQNTSTDNNQVHPLGDFYADLLSQPIPKTSRATSSSSSSSTSPTSTDSNLPNWVASSSDNSAAARAAKLFGTIRGSGYERKILPSASPDSTWSTVNGVPIPPRPSEPDNCCMSGCVHCVWDDYRDDIEEWAGRLKQAQAKAAQVRGAEDNEVAVKKTPKVDLQRHEVASASGSMDDDGGGSEALWDAPRTEVGGAAVDGDELFAGIPVGIREFMNIEKKIRERKRARMKDGAAEEEGV